MFFLLCLSLLVAFFQSSIQVRNLSRSLKLPLALMAREIVKTLFLCENLSYNAREAR